MIIRKKRIRSIDQALKRLLPNTEFRVTVRVDMIAKDLLAKAGLPDPATPGDTFLPSAIGPVSRFNAHGRFEILKDRPKERRFMQTIEWSWTEWHGRYSEERTEFRDIYKDCYQRKEIPAPAHELSYVIADDEHLLVSGIFVKRAADEEINLHVINLFLELFGQCEIRHANLKALLPPKIKRVNWIILPPGRHPWSKVEDHVKKILKDLSPRFRNPITFRQAKLAEHQPDEVYCGAGGFSTYLAYVFKEKKVTVLESLEIDNATYLFGQDWQQLSQMTKAEILQQKLHLDRVIHTTEWERKLRAHLK